VEKDPEEKRVRWLDDDELKKLFKALKSSQSESLEDLIHFSLNTGCRKSEALGLRWNDVDFKNGQIIFRNVKCESVCVNAFINDSGEPEFDIQTQVFEEGLKNKDKMKILKLDNMKEVRDILLKRRGNPEREGMMSRCFIFVALHSQFFQCFFRFCRIMFPPKVYYSSIPLHTFFH